MVPICVYYRHGGFSEPGGGYSGRAESRTCRFYVRGRTYKRRRGGHQSSRCGHSKRSAVFPGVLIAAVIIAGAVTAVAGILIGIPVLRLKGDYLAIVTLAFR